MLNLLLIIIHILVLVQPSLSQEAEDPCTPNPCVHGSCTPTADGEGYKWNFMCTCEEGYIGNQCQWDGPECLAGTRTPCVNGATCVVKQDGRFCMCEGNTNSTARYSGHYCEIKDPCLDCPPEATKCQAAPTWRRKRVCLLSNFQLIEED